MSYQLTYTHTDRTSSQIIYFIPTALPLIRTVNIDKTKGRYGMATFIGRKDENIKHGTKQEEEQDHKGRGNKG